MSKKERKEYPWREIVLKVIWICHDKILSSICIYKDLAGPVQGWERPVEGQGWEGTLLR